MEDNPKYPELAFIADELAPIIGACLAAIPLLVAAIVIVVAVLVFYTASAGICLAVIPVRLAFAKLTKRWGFKWKTY